MSALDDLRERAGQAHEFDWRLCVVPMSQVEKYVSDLVARLDAVLAIVNRPELIDFPKAVMLEAQHQEVRWGTQDRSGKEPSDWFWLVGHLAGRALEHHKEADRLADELVSAGIHEPFVAKQVAYHREKAVHHCITSAAALAHWHANMLGAHTAMQPGHAPSIAIGDGS